MDYKQTLAEIVLHLSRKHPEVLRSLSINGISIFDNGDQKKIEYFYDDLDCELAALCDKYGSDKGSLKTDNHPYPWPAHTYADYYRRIWEGRRASVKKVFECGLGTNNPSLPSSMGMDGKPGASLRVWRDYFPNTIVYGADIDKSILFSEDRILTGYLDQTDPLSVKDYWDCINEDDFDFMIDDGLHKFEAAICLFENSINRLAECGFYVIEDVMINDMLRYKDYFKNSCYLVDYVILHRPNISVGDNNLIVIKKKTG